MCFIRTFLNLQSPLEQFEVSSYGTSLSITVTNSVDLINEAFIPTFIKYTFINLFFILFLYSILRSLELFFKQEGFLLLFFFLTAIYTCFNFYSFTDFTVSENSFQYIINEFKTPKKPDFCGYTFTFADWFNSIPPFISEIHPTFNCQYPWFEYLFYTKNFIPNIIFSSKVLVGYAWFFGYIFNLEFLNRFDENSSDLCINLSNIFHKINIGDLGGIIRNSRWLSENPDFIFFNDVLLPKYQYIIDSIQLSFNNHNIYTHQVIYSNNMPNWIVFLLIFVGIFLAINPGQLNLNNMDSSVSLELFIKDPVSLIKYVENNISNNLFMYIYNQIIHTATTFSYYIIESIEYIILKKISYHSPLDATNPWIVKTPTLIDFEDLFITTFFNNNIFITINTSFINIYSIFFCFIFIFCIVYLIFNKSFTYNTNTIIPNIYQMLGENLYKISLNLFYSILGKHITHPEFYIKINTIFLFLVISNVQGMIPYMNTLTSALTNTFFIALALFISIINTLLDKKGINYFLNLFMPSGCPIFLVLLLIPIEVISYSFRVISISVRLFANMMAGHTLLKVIVGFSWVIVYLGNTSLINLFPIIILFILTLLEFGVAFIQAYIFTILSCMYIRDIFNGH